MGVRGPYLLSCGLINADLCPCLAQTICPVCRVWMLLLFLCSGSPCVGGLAFFFFFFFPFCPRRASWHLIKVWSVVQGGDLWWETQREVGERSRREGFKTDSFPKLLWFVVDVIVAVFVALSENTSGYRLTHYNTFEKKTSGCWASSVSAIWPTGPCTGQKCPRNLHN